ncbi:MAG: RdgB/HAM1 family non-canonical purine NTP pyrophosphatase [Candidatus Omnitrophota bacterium]|nr:MAG: RdgB/HAM1 family non-canonical purine NTP pyrophosphatase [Candidatus Omnitrophota bacterium]
MRLIIATRNKGKLREIKHILGGLNLSIISLNQLKKPIRIKEDGHTFLENALKKALPVSRMYPLDLTVGEDSGLEVECLNGAPGILSKRYCGRGATDLKNNSKLLKKLGGLKGKERKACFRCVLSLVKAGKLLKAFEGRLKGVISKEMKGKGGFGYDPVFYLPSYKKTVAQLSLSQKNKISHRARAFKKLHNYLAKLV